MSKIHVYTSRLLFVLLIPIGILMTNIASRLPDKVERYYSSSFYHILSQYYSRICGILPFSVAEIGLLLIISIIIWRFLNVAVAFIRHKRGAVTALAKFTVNILAAVGIVYFVFVTAWGLNYYRMTFSEIAGYDVGKVTKEELVSVCRILVDNANSLRLKVPEGSDGVMCSSASIYETMGKVNEGFDSLAAGYPVLGGKYSKPKVVLVPQIMSYMGISGIYSPFTAEANVNTSIPSSMLPSTACHEAAHLRGFAREDEANYIAYLVCMHNNDADFKYSGTLLAMIYSMDALYDFDRQAYAGLVKTYSAGMKRDLTAINKYWDKYSGPVERASDRLNDTYLKANKQAQGVVSYGRMVDLLIGQYRRDKLQ